MEVVHASIQGLAASNYDLLGVENSSNFPPEVFCSQLPGHYLTMALVFGPEELRDARKNTQETKMSPGPSVMVHVSPMG